MYSPEPTLTSLKNRLTSLGANHIFTYDELSDKTLNLRSKIPDLTGGRGVKLGLNCVGGKETSLMAGLLGYNTSSFSHGCSVTHCPRFPGKMHTLFPMEPCPSNPFPFQRLFTYSEA